MDSTRGGDNNKDQQKKFLKMPWTTEQKTFCVETYFKTKSIKTVQAKFRRRFNFNHYPNKPMIYRWVNKFKSKGTVLKLSVKSEGVATWRHLGVGVAGNVDAVPASVSRSPKKSIRRRSQELGFPRESLRRILVTDHKLYSYKIQIKQKLTQGDRWSRVIMYRWFC